MKKALIFALGLILTLLFSCQSKIEKQEVINVEMVSKRLESIKSASFFYTSSASAPGDTVGFNTYKAFETMIVNPADTFLGAKFYISSCENINEYLLGYDGDFIVRFEWDSRIARIDTLTSTSSRALMEPIFVAAKALINYSNINKDSTFIKYEYFQDSTKICFSFPNQLVQFHGIRHKTYQEVGVTSRYELWIDKTGLPYKFVRRLPHQTSWIVCNNVVINDEKDNNIKVQDLIPPTFAILGRNSKRPNPQTLEGKKAIDWSLKSTDGDIVSLNKLNKKVILLQFTGIGCGPCHQSITFLNQLVNDNIEKDFEIISIETWSDNIDGIKRYKEQNALNYTFLASNRDISSKYLIYGVPVFFILDENRVIRKVIQGYSKDETDKEIIKVVNDLL